MQPVFTVASAVLATVLATPLAAFADPAANAGALGSPGASDVAPAAVIAAVEPRLNPFGGTTLAVSSDKLAGVRGGAEVTVSDMRLHGTVADNAAINTLSGSNLISDGSFANSAGLPTVIQNTGSNVLIQNATILNVQFK